MASKISYELSNLINFPKIRFFSVDELVNFVEDHSEYLRQRGQFARFTVVKKMKIGKRDIILHIINCVLPSNENLDLKFAFLKTSPSTFNKKSKRWGKERTDPGFWDFPDVNEEDEKSHPLSFDPELMGKKRPEMSENIESPQEAVTELSSPKNSSDLTSQSEGSPSAGNTIDEPVFDDFLEELF